MKRQQYKREERAYAFCAMMEPSSVRLGIVQRARSEADAVAQVQDRFDGGYFHPNLVYVWLQDNVMYI